MIPRNEDSMAAAPLRLAFMGSPDFAVPALRALHAAGHHIAAVYSQPPRRSGRGQQETPCPVHRAALALGLPIRTPARLRHESREHEAFAALELDAAVVAAYGLILPKPMLEAPRRGCLNIHASLLPRWRGAAPIQAAILAGDAETGITIMRMEEGLDTGPMLLSRAVPIGPRDGMRAIHDALAALGAELILEALAQQPEPRPQPDQGVTYAPKLGKADGLLDWTQPAAVLDRRVRALNPWPGTFFAHRGEPIRLLAAEPGPDGAHSPGTVVDATPAIACGQGTTLRALVLQRPGRSPLPATEFLRGYPLPPGTVLG
jgi:methionyl-tRNA formyltransferase